MARLPATVDAPIAAGEEHEFAVDRARLRFFDADTGRRTEPARLMTAAATRRPGRARPRPPLARRRGSPTARARWPGSSCMPSVVYILALVAVPFVLAIGFALSDVTAGDPSFDWVGLRNFGASSTTRCSGARWATRSSSPASRWC